MQARPLLLLFTLPCLAMSCWSYAALPSQTILVSGYNSQLSRYTLNQTSTGPVLEQAGVWDVDRDMTWLQVEGDMLYAAHEVESYKGAAGGAISRWNMTQEGPKKMEVINLPTASPAHLLVSLDQDLAFCANYGGHSWSAVNMDQGKLGEVVYHETFGTGCRDASHPHQTVMYGPWVWVVDLGCDTIWHYKVENKEVVKLGKTVVKAGSGPRHMVVHEERKLLFLVGELMSLVEVYRLNEIDGSLTLVQQVELSPHKEDYGAEILLGPGGRHVYASSRGSGLIIVYRLGEDDRLVKVQEFYLGGTWPRHFAIHGDNMVVADQRGDSLQLVSINSNTGELSGGDMVRTAEQPAFVCFVD